MLPDLAWIRIVVADEEHVIPGAERVEEGADLFRRSETGLIENVESLRVCRPILAARPDQMQLQGFRGNALLLQRIASFAGRRKPFNTEAVLFRNLPQDAGGGRLRASGRTLHRDKLVPRRQNPAKDLLPFRIVCELRIGAQI